jgi:hypothetical protein
MAPRRATEAARSSEAASQPAAPLLESRIKSNRELQTVREMVGSKNSEWGATRIWHGRMPREALPATAQPFFLFFIFAGLVPPFSPFLLVILETYGIQAIHLLIRGVPIFSASTM